MSGVDSDQMFRRFLERISDCAMVVLDRQGRVGSWNAGARTIIGYEPDDILTQQMAIFFSEEDRAAGLPDLALATAMSLGRFETEAWQVRKGGDRFWASIAITAILDDDGSVKGFGAMTRDLTERLRMEEKKASVMALLEKSATTDFLTGCANRRALDAALITSMATAKRHGRALSVAMVDLDHFKTFNDTKGHQAGDLYLQEAITCWRTVLRLDCVLARYGGEEFTVIMPDTDLAQAIEAMTRLREANPAPNTCSIGVVQWDLFESADGLIQRADQGLYAAKAAGRNCAMVGPGPGRDATPVVLYRDADKDNEVQRRSA